VRPTIENARAIENARVGLRSAASRALVGLALTGLVLGAAGCSGQGSGSGSSGPVATTTVDLPPSYRFSPAEISVTSGATVTWTNHDNFTHSVAFLDGGLPSDPRVVKPGETTTFTFTSPGTFHYQCSFHPQNMKGTVIVSS
jgi:plastocyanin